MKPALLVLVWLTMVASISPARAQSGDILQPRNGLSVDDHIARELQERRGVVIIDAMLMEPSITGGLTRCGFPAATLAQTPNKDAPTKTVRGSVDAGGGKVLFGGITSLPPGEHLLLTIACSNLNTSYNGPHAKFQVRAGEIVNVGTFRLDHKSDGLFSLTGNMYRSVQDLSPEVVDFLKSRAPRAMAKVVKRSMTMLGPADTATRTRIQSP